MLKSTQIWEREEDFHQPEELLSPSLRPPCARGDPNSRPQSSQNTWKVCNKQLQPLPWTTCNFTQQLMKNLAERIGKGKKMQAERKSEAHVLLTPLEEDTKQRGVSDVVKETKGARQGGCGARSFKMGKIRAMWVARPTQGFGCACRNWRVLNTEQGL